MVWSPKAKVSEISPSKNQSDAVTKESLGYSASASSSFNLYGRAKNRNLLPPNFPIPPLQTNSPRPSNSQYVYFSTIFVQYRIRYTTAYLRYGSIDPRWDSTHRTIYHLLNNSSQVCGYILLPSTFQSLHPNQFYPPPPHCLRRGMVSRWQWNRTYFRISTLSKANYHCEWGRPHEAHSYRKSWEMEDYIEVHVMMVKTRDDGVMERVGIGRVHEEAIKHGCGEGARWKDVVLG